MNWWCRTARSVLLTFIVLAMHATCGAAGYDEPRPQNRVDGWMRSGYDASRARCLNTTVSTKGRRKRLKRLDIAATDLFFSPTTGSLYVTVGADSSRYAGSLIEVDPRTRKVLNEIPLGGDPARMSVSDADRTAWVILDRARVARVDLAARRVLTVFTPTVDSTGDAIIPITVAVRPGHPETVAVSFVFESHTGEVAVALYDDGVRRPAAIAGFSAGQLIFAGDVLWANRAFEQSYAAVVRKIAIRQEGLVWDGAEDTFMGNNAVSLEDGRFYVTTGEIFDAASLKRVGWIPTGDAPIVGAHVVDEAAGKIYYAFNYAFSLILVYDINTERIEGYVDGTVYHQASGIREMVLCGDVGVATLDHGVTFYPPKVFKTLAPYERPAPVPENGQVRVIELRAGYIVYDDVHRKIYATVSPGNPGIGNTVVEVDPYSGSVGRDVLIGSAPGIVRLSPDCTDLFIALWGSYQVRRCRLPDITTETTVELSRGPYAVNAGAVQMNAQEIVPLPESPAAMAVLYSWQPWYPEQTSEGVAVYDDAVRRPNYTDWWKTPSGSLVLDGDGRTLYGLNNTSTGFEFLKYTVDSSGVVESDSFDRVGQAFFDRLHIAGTRCYLDSGLVVDVHTAERVGQLAYNYSAFTTKIVVPDAPRNRVYLLAANDDGFEITSYDMTTLERVGSVHIPPFPSYYVADLLVWDDGRQLAFSAGDRIYLVPVALLAP